MSWASRRQTAIPEDMAYCLLGLFDVKMSPMYGEGGVQAFLRLQEEIIKISSDGTIFAWTSPHSPPNDFQTLHGLLAESVDCFADSYDIFLARPIYDDHKPYRMTNRGLSITFPVAQRQNTPNISLARIYCGRPSRRLASMQCEHLGIYLPRMRNGTFRINANCLAVIEEGRDRW